MNEATTKAIKGSLWSFSGQYISKAFIFITSIFITYFLTPEEYGLANYALTASTIFILFNDLGIGSAIIYVDDSEENKSTAFWILLINSLLLSVIGWFLAPWIANYFSDQRVIPLFRLFCLYFPIFAFMNVHDSLLQKEIDFKKKLVPDIMNQITKSASSILFAVLGFGAVSVITGNLIGALFGAVFLWIINPWRPKFIFSKESAKKILSFGFSMLIIQFLAMVALQIDKWLIGRYLSVAMMGIYSIGIRIPEYLVKQISLSISNVSFPLFSQIKDNREHLISTFKNSVYAMTIFSFPLGIGLFLVTDPLIKMVYPDNWLSIIPVIKIFSIQYVILSITYNVGNLLKANNHLKIFMMVIVYRIAIIFIALFTALKYTKEIVPISLVILLISPIAYTFIDIFISHKLFGISVMDFFNSIKNPLIASILMFVVVYPISLLIKDQINIIQIIIISLVGASIYIFTIAKLAPTLFKQMKEKVFSKKS
jgi:PST family polysaccharide transporter